MRYAAATAAGALTSFTLLQSTPAPWFGLATFIGGAVIEGIVYHVGKRDGLPGDEHIIDTRQGPCGPVPDGVPYQVFDDCCNALQGQTIHVEGYDGNRVRASGIPYACISAAPWFNEGGPVPYACGDDCLEYGGLSSDEYNHLVDVYESL